MNIHIFLRRAFRGNFGYRYVMRLIRHISFHPYLRKIIIVLERFRFRRYGGNPDRGHGLYDVSNS